MLPIRLCQTLNEKINHDFAGTIGVIDNSTRLIKSKEYQEKAIQLLKSSATKLIERLQFYRHLYSTPSDKNIINIREVNKLTINLLKLRNNNIELVFQDFPLNIKDSLSKMVMCLIFIASNHLIKGGIIKVALKREINNFISIRIMVINSQLRLYEDKTEVLLGKGDINNINSGSVHEYYTYYLVTEYGYNLTINSTADSIEYILNMVKL